MDSRPLERGTRMRISGQVNSLALTLQLFSFRTLSFHLFANPFPAFSSPN